MLHHNGSCVDPTTKHALSAYAKLAMQTPLCTCTHQTVCVCVCVCLCIMLPGGKIAGVVVVAVLGSVLLIGAAFSAFKMLRNEGVFPLRRRTDSTYGGVGGGGSGAGLPTGGSAYSPVFTGQSYTPGLIKPKLTLPPQVSTHTHTHTHTHTRRQTHTCKPQGAGPSFPVCRQRQGQGWMCVYVCVCVCVCVCV